MKIYTKTGDKGSTALYGGTRIPKYDLRIDSYGTVDELNSYLGLLRDQEISAHQEQILIKIQHDLFTIGAILATDPEKMLLKNGKERLNIPKIQDENIHLLEQEIDQMDAALPPMTHFILPGGHQTVSVCHVARSICRRAERLACALHNNSPFDTNTLQYLNRLSDYLFVLARMLSQKTGAKEIKWVPKKNP